MVWKASAPSNIALIKYMGKLDFAKNIPSNASLSYTLENLRTYVTLEKTSSSQDMWEPLQQEGCLTVQLSKSAIDRFVNFFKKLKTYYRVQENFLIRSANNFPSDSGMASSASSFAALTSVAHQAFLELGYKNHSGLELYQMSREGSGSSCRSFFSPWAIWKGEEVFKPDIKFNLIHRLILVDAKKKEVSSGEAHKRVESSLLNQGRSQRAQQRLDDLIVAFNSNNWPLAYEIVWAEFWDMHTLFETSYPHFRYMNSESIRVLYEIDNQWKTFGSGPLVTMDAGPNIHLLFRSEDEAKIYEKIFKEKNIKCI